MNDSQQAWSGWEAWSALRALLLSAGTASNAGSPRAGAPEIIYGPAASADSVITASVDGAECETAVPAATDAYESGFGWSIQIDPDECGAPLGSAITFTVDGAAADETVTWSGGVTELTLTTAPMDVRRHGW